MPVSTLLLLPGLMCDCATFEPVLPVLAPRVRCVVPVYADCNSIGAMADIALDGAPARFALLGHSMGGHGALKVIRRAPERVERLALLDTGYQPRAAGEAGEREREQRMALLDVARRDGVRAMAERWVRTPMVHPSRLADAVLVGAIDALLARPDATGVLARIACPTLVMCGRDDAWASYERHADMQARIAGSRLVAIEHSGHMVTMERPQESATAIAEWLEECSSGMMLNLPRRVPARRARRLRCDRSPVAPARRRRRC